MTIQSSRLGRIISESALKMVVVGDSQVGYGNIGQVTGDKTTAWDPTFKMGLSRNLVPCWIGRAGSNQVKSIHLLLYSTGSFRASPWEKLH